MAVNAVTPRLPAIGGGLQFYRDADFYDVDQDERATGEDIYDPEWPDKPLRLKPTRGRHARPTPSFPNVGAPSGAGEPPAALLGSGPGGSPLGRARTDSSPPGTGAVETSSDEQSRPGWSPDGS